MAVEFPCVARFSPELQPHRRMLCRRSLRLLPPHDACGQGVLNGAPRARDNQPREPYSGSYYRFGGKPIMTKKSERLTSSSDYKNARESGTAASHAECDSGVYLARLLVRRSHLREQTNCGLSRSSTRSPLAFRHRYRRGVGGPYPVFASRRSRRNTRDLVNLSAPRGGGRGELPSS